MRERKFSLFTVFLITGCSTGIMMVDSTPPDSEIFVRSRSSENFQLIGKTPYKLSTGELKDKFNVEGAFALQTRHEGYEPQMVFVSEVPPNAEMNLFLNLKTLDQKALSEGSGNPEVLNKTLDQLFESQRLVKVGRYDDALIRLDQLAKENPNIAAIYEMQGGVFYIQKNYTKALDSYQKALRLNPENLELVNMKRYLEKYTKKTEASKP